MRKPNDSLNRYSAELIIARPGCLLGCACAALLTFVGASRPPWGLALVGVVLVLAWIRPNERSWSGSAVRLSADGRIRTADDWHGLSRRGSMLLGFALRLVLQDSSGRVRVAWAFRSQQRSDDWRRLRVIWYHGEF